jgi:hypothetical protein
MRIASRFLKQFVIFAAVNAALALVTPLHAQSSASDELTVQVTPADHSAALGAKVGVQHAYPAMNAAGRALRARQTAERRPSTTASDDGQPSAKILQYAGDVTSLGGEVLKYAVSHAIYLQRQTGAQCTIASCWGDPEGFLRDLGNSDFVHVIDQYVGSHDANRYTVGFHATVNYKPQTTPLLDSDIVALLHAVAAKSGASGHGHIYHVFLPPGQDECFDSTLSVCYSPDSPATFAFCAYHDYADFPDIGHVIYTVHPYANVSGGCQVQPGTPNGELVDSTNNTLNHETFETITDPDLDAWRNEGGAADLATLEIADECQFFVIRDGQYFADVPTFLIGAHRYAVQLVYSNEEHACSSAASRGNP